jgi:hypothetical protein
VVQGDRCRLQAGGLKPAAVAMSTRRRDVASTGSDRQAVNVPVRALALPGVGATLIDHELPTAVVAIWLPLEMVSTADEFAGSVPVQTNDASATEVS